MIYKPSFLTSMRAAGNILRIIVIASLILALLYASSVFLVNFFLASGRGRAIMNDALRGYGLREFSARRIHLSLGGTLTLEDFALSRTFGFSNGTVLSASKISVHVKPVSLFGRQPLDVYAVSDIEAHGRRAHVEVVLLADTLRKLLIVQRGVVDKALVFMGQVDMAGKIPNYNLTVNGDRATWEKLMEMATGNNTVRTNLRSKICLLISGNSDCLVIENKPLK